jgi:hypothetical protein
MRTLVVYDGGRTTQRPVAAGCEVTGEVVATPTAR